MNSKTIFLIFILSMSGNAYPDNELINLIKLADEGITEASLNLGQMYSTGRGVEQNYKQAVSWYQKAADQGSAIGQCNLGYMYEKGKGIARDYNQAINWYKKAADQGSATAYFNLGSNYLLMFFKSFFII